MKLPPEYFCLSCYHSRCEKGKPLRCVITNTDCKGRCAKYEAIRGRVVPK